MRRNLTFALLLLVPILCQCSHEPELTFDEPWRTRLYAPTMMDRIDGVWFIVDTWHHRILFADEFSSDLSDWRTLTESAAGPHSIASDGDFFLYDNTGRGELHAVRKVRLNEDVTLTETNVIPDMGTRPHRVVYDEATERFYTIASLSQEIIRLRSESGEAVVEHRFHAPFLNGVYSRSLSIIGDRMYIVSSNGRISETTYRQGEYEVLNVYQLPSKFKAMIDIYQSSNGWYYLSAKPRGFGRSRTLEGFATGDYEDLYGRLGLKGIPYYITEVEGRLVVPFQETANGFISFEEDATDRSQMSRHCPISARRRWLTWCASSWGLFDRPKKSARTSARALFPNG